MNQIFASTVSGQEVLKDETIEPLLDWFNIAEVDRKALKRLYGKTQGRADAIINAFYDHLLSHDIAASHFKDKTVLERVKKAQKRYFGQLMQEEITPSYMAERRRIGGVHESFGITPTIYLGAYSFYLDRVALELVDDMQVDPVPVLRMLLALMKMAQFDMSLALEAYVEKREMTIRERERELQELATPVLSLKEGLLLVPVVGSLDEFRARKLTLDLLEGIRDYSARVVVLDITGVTEADSAVSNHLIQCMDAAELMGVTPVLTGISVDVARSLVKIGLSKENLRTAGDLKRGLEFADRLLAE